MSKDQKFAILSGFSEHGDHVASLTEDAGLCLLAPERLIAHKESHTVTALPAKSFRVAPEDCGILAELLAQGGHIPPPLVGLWAAAVNFVGNRSVKNIENLALMVERVAEFAPIEKAHERLSAKAKKKDQSTDDSQPTLFDGGGNEA